MTKGALYIAYGDAAVRQATISISTLRQRAPKLPIAVVSNKNSFPSCTFIERPDADLGAREWKTRMYELSPFDKTLFLDADTEVLSSPEAGFKLLEYVDIVLGQDLHRIFMSAIAYSKLVREEVTATVSEIGGEHFMYFNSGVIFFNKNERVKAMMEEWHREWERWKTHDQPALLRAIHSSPVRIAPIRSPWNTNIRTNVAFVWHKYRQARREGSPK